MKTEYFTGNPAYSIPSYSSAACGLVAGEGKRSILSAVSYTIGVALMRQVGWDRWQWVVAMVRRRHRGVPLGASVLGSPLNSTAASFAAVLPAPKSGGGHQLGQNQRRKRREAAPTTVLCAPKHLWSTHVYDQRRTAMGRVDRTPFAQLVERERWARREVSSSHIRGHEEAASYQRVDQLG